MRRGGIRNSASSMVRSSVDMGGIMRGRVREFMGEAGLRGKDAQPQLEGVTDGEGGWRLCAISGVIFNAQAD